MAAEEIIFNVAPGGCLQGDVTVPGDKSISHRAIMLGALAEGETRISGFLQGEDSINTLRAFRSMGVQIEMLQSGEVCIQGVGLHGLKAPIQPLDLGNSGTAIRLLCGLLAAQRFDSVLQGDASLHKRPMARIAEPLRQMGAHIQTAANGCPPLRIQGGQRLEGMHYRMPVASAQVKSGLLLAGLYAVGRTCVSEPAPTRDHTERMLQSFSYPLDRQGETVCIISGGRLQATHVRIPGDISSAAFLMVAGSIAENSDIVLRQVGINPTRTGVIEILQAMGARITLNNKRMLGGEPVADIRVQSAPLQGIEIPPHCVPLAIDEFPVIFIAAACARGQTCLRGGQELRVKESDRIQVMADGLLRLGVKAEATDDGMIIEGKPEPACLQGAEIESHDDHRIAMAFAIAALRASSPLTIRRCNNVNTSFPGFAELLAGLGLAINQLS